MAAACGAEFGYASNTATLPDGATRGGVTATTSGVFATAWRTLATA